MGVAPGLDELGGDSQVGAGLADASFEDIADVEVPGDFGDGLGSILCRSSPSFAR